MAEWIGRKRKYQEFVGFEFNGIHSSQLNLYRVSDGSRYNEDMSAAFQDKTVQAPGRDGTFYFGTNYTQRTFNIQIAFDSMTEDDMHEFRRIFAAKEEGYLIFDETNYKKYKVKIQTPPQLKYICFDAPVDPVQESNTPSSIPHIKNGKINYTFGSTSNKGKVYKGEGTIQFVAYYPFAVEVYKYLADYNNNQNSKNLIPQNYYSPQTRTCYGVTFEKREDADNYGAVAMSGTHTTKSESYYVFVQYTDPIEITTTTTYYLNPTGSTDFKYIVSQVHPDGTRTRIMTADSTLATSCSLYAGDRVYVFLMVPKTSTVTLNNPTGFFPVFTSTSVVTVSDVRYTLTSPNSVLHIPYSLKGTSTSNPYAKYIGYYDWKGPSRMKDAKIISGNEASGSLYFDTTTVITTTEATSQVIDSIGGSLFKQGDSVVKLYNAGEIDSDLVFYTTAQTDTTASPANNYKDFVKRPVIIQLIKHTKKDDEDDWEVVEQLNLKADFTRFAGDYYIRYNSKTNLLEGGTYDSKYRDTFNFPFRPTGTIYNTMIDSGNFFKVPAYEEGVTYYLRATASTIPWNPKPTMPTTNPSSWDETTYGAYRCIYSTIKYNHVWY